MHESFEITSSTGKYSVTVGADMVGRVLKENPDAIFLVDDFMVPWVRVPQDRLVAVVATEEEKSLERMPDIIAKLRQKGANKTTHLVAVGGGVLQDIATFASSVFMRGITWTYMPSTLLGMVDSCIGGKSSINVAGYKNLVGNFYPPEDILIDSNFASTLNEEQVVGGLFEAGKICFARGEADFNAYLQENPAPTLSADQVRRIVSLSLRTKKWFIEIDEFDRKERLLLNYGHTFGHAIEAGTEFGVSHGIAVGVGMLVAVQYARDRSWLNEEGLRRSSVLDDHIKSMLSQIDHVMVRPDTIPLAKVLEKFDNDKKHQTASYRIVCPREDGSLELVSEPKSDQVRQQLLRAYGVALDDLGWPRSA